MADNKHSDIDRVHTARWLDIVKKTLVIVAILIVVSVAIAATTLVARHCDARRRSRWEAAPLEMQRAIVVDILSYDHTTVHARRMTTSRDRRALKTLVLLPPLFVSDLVYRDHIVKRQPVIVERQWHDWLGNYSKKERLELTQQEVEVIAQSIVDYRRNVGSFPSELHLAVILKGNDSTVH